MTHRKQRCTSCGHSLRPDENPAECLVCMAQEWESLCLVQKSIYTSRHCPWCCYSFLGDAFYDAPSLARSFARNWTEALAALRTTPPDGWVRDALANPAQAEFLREFGGDPWLDECQRLTLTLAVLDPSLPLYWQGAELTEALLAADPEKTLLLLGSPVPRCCRAAGVHEWLPALEGRWRELEVTVSTCLPRSAARPTAQGILGLMLGKPAASDVSDALAVALAHAGLKAHEFSSSLSKRAARFRELALAYPSPPPLPPPPPVVFRNPWKSPPGRRSPAPEGTTAPQPLPDSLPSAFDRPAESKWHAEPELDRGLTMIGVLRALWRFLKFFAVFLLPSLH